MITEIYTIFDNVSCEAGPIFQAKNLFVASRYVKNLIDESPVNPSDYELVRLGTFDSESLIINVLSSDKRDSFPLSLVSTFGDDAKEFMKKNASDDDFKKFMENYFPEEDN